MIYELQFFCSDERSWSVYRLELIVKVSSPDPLLLMQKKKKKKLLKGLNSMWLMLIKKDMS